MNAYSLASPNVERKDVCCSPMAVECNPISDVIVKYKPPKNNNALPISFFKWDADIPHLRNKPAHVSLLKIDNKFHKHRKSQSKAKSYDESDIPNAPSIKSNEGNLKIYTRNAQLLITEIISKKSNSPLLPSQLENYKAFKGKPINDLWPTANLSSIQCTEMLLPMHANKKTITNIKKQNQTLGVSIIHKIIHRKGIVNKFKFAPLVHTALNHSNINCKEQHHTLPSSTKKLHKLNLPEIKSRVLQLIHSHSPMNKYFSHNSKQSDCIEQRRNHCFIKKLIPLASIMREAKDSSQASADFLKRNKYTHHYRANTDNIV